jgi:hypothetical protein
MADLVKATFTGRNFGWQPRESNDSVIAGIALNPGDVEPLVSFLRSLNEDYN